MIDPKIIRETPEKVRESFRKRHADAGILDAYITLDQNWRTQLQEAESLKAELKSKTPKGKPDPEWVLQLRQLSQDVKTKEEALAKLEEEVKRAAMGLPNILAEDTPEGKDSEQNVEVHTWGTPRAFTFMPKPHEEVAQNINLIDFERAAKISGSRFAVLKGMGAKLERALAQLMLDLHTQKGYTEILPPVLVRSAALQGTGQLPKFAEDLFQVAETDFWLSPTSEVQLTNLFQNEIIDEKNLPVKLTAFTSCFRKEAGSYGKDVKGIIRQHQFNKVELVKLTTPDTSMAELDALRENAEAVLQALELPYRVVRLCGGDVGFGSAKTYDIEVWFPSQNMFREISSCSNFLDFQSRRAMIRYRPKNGEVSYLHTLNGSGVAIGRAWAAILENYQNEDGSVTIPKVLQSYMGAGRLG